MNIFISGSTSILASALIEFFFEEGHNLFISDVLSGNREDAVNSLLQRTGGKPIDLVFLLHGLDIVNSRLSRYHLPQKIKQHIRNAESLCNHFAESAHKPQAIFLASSTYIYKENEQDKSFEDSPLDSTILASFFHQLEQSTTAAQKNGMRTVHLRLGNLVAQDSQPAYPKLPIFNKLIPAVFQEEKISLSWVSREDALQAICHILTDKDIHGPVNICSGDILSKVEFFKVVANRFQLSRTFPIPKILLKLLLGPEALNLVYTSSRAIPFKLLESGFLFEDISLQEYLQEDND